MPCFTSGSCRMSRNEPVFRKMSLRPACAPLHKPAGWCILVGEQKKERTTIEVPRDGYMLDTATKQRIIGEYQSKPGDTGSTEVQVALLSERIRGLTDHLRRNHKDHATRRGLLKLVGQRRRLLRYLAREDAGRYRTVISRLGLRR